MLLFWNSFNSLLASAILTSKDIFICAIVCGCVDGRRERVSMCEKERDLEGHIDSAWESVNVSVCEWRERDRKIDIVFTCERERNTDRASVNVCVCLCVWEREGKRERV